MPVLNPIEFERNLEYGVEKAGEVFVAGISNAHFKPCYFGQFEGDLYLDRVIPVYARLWNPGFLNTFAVTLVEINSMKREFFLDNLFIPSSGFQQFSNELNSMLLYKHGCLMNDEDIRTFFLKLYDYYAGISEAVRKLCRGSR